MHRCGRVWRTGVKRVVSILMLILLASCRDHGVPQAARDDMASINGLWELVAVECADGPSLSWQQLMSQRPINSRKHVNNGQTIDYVVDSNNCLQTTTGHIVPQGRFLFNRFGYHRYCNEACGSAAIGCGPQNSETMTRIQVLGDEMQISENDPGLCARSGQRGPLTTRYKKLRQAATAAAQSTN